MIKKWLNARKIERYQKAAKKDEDKKVKAISAHLRELYGFVKHLNDEILPNRHARKGFWIRVSRGEPLLEKTIELMIKKYEPIPKVKIKNEKPIMPTLPLVKKSKVPKMKTPKKSFKPSENPEISTRPSDREDKK